MKLTWNHTICERCWFTIRPPDRVPYQSLRGPEDPWIDNCCMCGEPKVTRIWVRLDPVSQLRCGGLHEDDDG